MQKNKTIKASYPLTSYEEVTSHLASMYETTFENNVAIVDSSLGEGWIEAYNFEDFSVMLVNLKINHDVIIDRVHGDLKGYLDFGFILNGISNFFASEVNENITQMVSGLYITTPSTVSGGNFRHDFRHEQFFILVKKEWLETYFECEMPLALQNTDKPMMHYYPIPYLAINDILMLMNSDYKIPFRKQHLYAKSIEILGFTLTTLLKDKKLGVKQNFHPDDISKIFNIANYINENIEQHLTIKAISEKYYINRDKLQVIFKSIYGKTIGNYTKKMRMTQAYILLLEGRNVQEVGQRLGYANLSHFAEGFRKVHGINPSEVLK